jgi:predicted dienelactone hydrolase
VRRSVDVIGRAAAIGALVSTLVCAAVAAENLHTGSRLIDWTIGVALVGVPVAIACAVLRVVTWIPSRVLRWIQRRTGAMHGSIGAISAGLDLVGRGWIATLVVIVVLVWGSPSDGAIALYHGLSYFEILIAIATVVGALIGLSFAIRGPAQDPRRHRAAAALLGVAGIIATATTGWAVTPGPGDPILREDAATLARIPLLDLPDPSERGPFTVVATSYGSGRDRHRDAYGAGVGWRTPTVDVSTALPARGDLPGAYADWFWGFGPATLPLNALLWYPEDAPGRRPVVLIVHGNHAAADYSDPGYAYLGEHLASRGHIVASIDENYLNGDAFFDYAGDEMAVRAWLLLRHLELLAGWDASPGHPLHGRADLDHVALIGHSRGGEAAALATMIARDPALTPPGLPAASAGRVRAVIAIAPSDGMYQGPGSPVRPSDIDYLVIQGAHDGDLPGFSGLRTYHRVTLGSAPGRLKVAVFSQRANHGRFNSVWDDGDAGPLPSWLLDRGSLLAPTEQERLAKTVFSAFLARSLDGETTYDSFFRDPRAGRAWLPDDVIETHWETSDRVPAEAGPRRSEIGTAARASGADRMTRLDPTLRDGVAQGDLATAIKWSAAVSYEVDVDAAAAARLEPGSALVFSITPWVEGSGRTDPIVELETASGVTASARLSDLSPARPLLPTRLWKIDGIGERYLPTEHQILAAERFMQTHEIPLDALLAGSREVDPSTITRVRLRFDTPGSALIDDIGFEPPSR